MVEWFMWSFRSDEVLSLHLTVVCSGGGGGGQLYLVLVSTDEQDRGQVPGWPRPGPPVHRDR